MRISDWSSDVCSSDLGVIFDELDIRSVCIIRQILASYSGLADIAFAMQGLGSGTISLAGNDAQQKAYLPAVVRGEKIAAFSMTEAHSGSDVAYMATPAQRRSEEHTCETPVTYAPLVCRRL